MASDDDREFVADDDIDQSNESEIYDNRKQFFSSSKGHSDDVTININNIKIIRSDKQPAKMIIFLFCIDI